MKISVITPSYNQGEFLERTIRSVLDQGYADLEYLVFDGGSNDASVSILKRYGEHLAHWESVEDRGQAHAVNKGLERATGDIIGWLNSDDVYRPGALRAVADHFESNPDSEFVYGRADYIDPSDKVLGPYRTRPWDYSALTRNCFVCQPSVFFRRRAVDRFGLLDESLQFCMDYEYWLRCGKRTPFAYLDQVLSASRLYPENKTLSSRPEIFEEACLMMKRELGHVPRRWLAEYALECNASSTKPAVSRLRASMSTLKAWHRFHWRYNRGVLPLYPPQLIAGLPVIPRAIYVLLRQLAR